MLTLGLDISSKKVAWATMGDDVAAGHVALPGKTAIERARRVWHSAVPAIVGTHARNATSVYIEKPYGLSASLSALVIGAVATCIPVVTPINYLAPSEWRKELYGEGGLSTEHAKTVALDLAAEHGLDREDHDEAEAFCLALLAYRTMLGGER